MEDTIEFAKGFIELLQINGIIFEHIDS